VKFLSGTEGASILAENIIVPGYLDSSVFDKFAQVEGFPNDNMGALVTETVYMEWPPHSLSGLLGKMVEEEIVLAMTENKSVDDAIKDMELRRDEIILLNQ